MTSVIVEQQHNCRRAIYNGVMVTICDKQCASCKEEEQDLVDYMENDE